MTKSRNYDIAIIGGGPAGLTAAIYAARGGMSTVVFEKMTAGGKMAITSEIENYPGFIKTDGYTLGMKFHEHAEYYGAEIVYSEVTGFELNRPDKQLRVADGVVTARAVILCMGSSPRKLGIADEEKFAGRGISHCATCDGNFFKGREVAVYGNGNMAVEDALYLAGICSKVYLVNKQHELSAEAVLAEKVKTHSKIVLMPDSMISGINGDKAVEGIAVKNTVSNESSAININGLFIAIGNTPNTLQARGIELNEKGYIITDSEKRTNLDKVYAAGDITDTPFKQVVTAAADGAIAAAAALKALK